MNPWILLAIAAAAATGSWQVQEWRYGSKEAARLEQQQKDARRQIDIADKAAGGFEVDRTRTKTEFLTITERVNHVVQSPVYLDVCFDADGLRALADATATTADPAQPGSTVPATAPVK